MLKPIMTQSPEAVQRLMENLVQRGEIILDEASEDNEEDVFEDAPENDSDLDLSDDDAPSIDMADGDEPFSDGSSFDIRVVSDGRGRFVCVPPENEWSSARPAKRKSRAESMVDALEERHRTFATIAERLTRDEGDLLAKGAEGFLDTHVRITQAAFARANGLDPKKLSRHIENAQLRWSDASFLLRELFAP